MGGAARTGLRMAFVSRAAHPALKSLLGFMASAPLDKRWAVIEFGYS